VVGGTYARSQWCLCLGSAGFAENHCQKWKNKGIVLGKVMNAPVQISKMQSSSEDFSYRRMKQNAQHRKKLILFHGECHFARGSLYVRLWLILLKSTSKRRKLIKKLSKVKVRVYLDALDGRLVEPLRFW
jgi:hypothetical protein